MRADKPNEKNAKNAILIADAEESVNILSAPSRILFVKGTADEAADSNKYATICKSHRLNWYVSLTPGEDTLY